MPFKSSSQMAKCYALKDPKWDCSKWAKETPNIKGLPLRVKVSKTKSKTKTKKYGKQNKKRK